MITTIIRTIGQRALKFSSPRRWISLAHRWHFQTDAGEYELMRLAEFVPRYRRAIDIGCHNGIYSYGLLALASEVIAFDANPAMAMFVRRALPKVHVENVALSSENGEAILRIPRGSILKPLEGQATVAAQNTLGNAAIDSVRVTKRTLDSYRFDDIGFIKIDVEGHEEGVIDGATDLLARDRPNLLIEIEERHNPGGVERTAMMLCKFGYRGYYFAPDSDNTARKLTPLAGFDPAVEQSKHLIELLDHSPRKRVPYVNNFLFLPE
jgi:FkbM family methyltransferase